MTIIKGKTILVTGASRGLGYQTAKLLAKEGAHVLGLARTVGALETLSDEINEFGGVSTMIPLDLTDDVSLNSLSKDIASRWGKLDFLVHVAGIPAPMSPVTSISLRDLDKLFLTNTRALVKLIQEIDPLLKLSSDAKALFVDDFYKGKFLATYSASKAASREIILSYKEESNRLGVTVMSFVPKPMPTALRARFHPGEAKKDLTNIKSQAENLISMLKS